VITARAFDVSVFFTKGKPLWKWIAKVALLIEKKIVWPEQFNNENDSRKYLVLVDGVDFLSEERYENRHPTFNIDPSYASHKYNKAAYKYEVAVSVYESKCVWINGPYKGTVHDITIFCNGLKAKILPGKKVIADKGYQSSRDDEHMLSTPNPLDNKITANFKSTECSYFRQQYLCSFDASIKFYSSEPS